MKKCNTKKILATMIKYGNDWHCYYLRISKDLRSSLCYYYLRTQTNSYPCSAGPTSHFHNYYSTSTWAKDGLNCMENFCHGALSLMGLWSCTTSGRSSLYRPSLIETFPYFNFMSTLRLTCVVRDKCFTIENSYFSECFKFEEDSADNTSI